MSENIFYLTKDYIYILHDMIIGDSGGDKGVYDFTDSRIESILSQQFPIFGYEKYPSIFDKSAMLLYFFCKGHCFVDGNKRVGIQSAIVFLTINGYTDYFDELEIYSKTIEIASSHITELNRDYYINDLAIWLSKKFR